MKCDIVDSHGNQKQKVSIIQISNEHKEKIHNLYLKMNTPEDWYEGNQDKWQNTDKYSWRSLIRRSTIRYVPLFDKIKSHRQQEILINDALLPIR